MNKTLQQWQDEIAVKYGYINWGELMENEGKHFVVYCMTEAAEAYARERCEAQKVKCAEGFKNSFVYINAQVEAILQAPNACDKTK